MKWFEFPLIFFFLFGFPLFQCGQLTDFNGWACGNFFILKSVYEDPLEDEFKVINQGVDSKPTHPSFDQIRFNFRLKNASPLFVPFVHRTSPFYRPPPVLTLSVFL